MKSLYVTLGVILFTAAILSSNGTDHGLTVTTYAACLLFATVSWLTTRSDRAELTLTDGCIILLGIWMVLALLNSEVASVSATALLAYSQLFLGYFLMRRIAIARVHDETISLAIGIVTLTGSILFLWLYLAHGSPIGGLYMYRHMFAMTVLMGLLFGIAGIQNGNSSYPFRLFIVLICGFCASLLAGLSGSRGVILASVMGFITLFLLGNRSTHRLSIPMLASSVLGLLTANLVTAGLTASRVISLGEPMISGRSRFMLWESVLPLIAQKPLLGHGPGMLFLVWPPYRYAGDRTAGSYAHQSFLDFATMIGIPGALLIAALFGLALFAGWQASRSSMKAPWITAAVAALFVHSMVDFSLFLHSLWLLFGICLGWLASYTPAISSRIATPVKRWLPIFSFTIILGLSIYGFTSTVGHYHQERAEHASQEGDMNIAFNRLSKAISWWPSADIPRTQRAHIITVSVLEDENALANPMLKDAMQVALNDSESAMDLNPYRPVVYTTAARVRMAGEQLGLLPNGTDTAQMYLASGLAKHPQNLLIRYRLAKLLDHRGEPGQAMEIILDGLEFWYPQNHAREDFFKYAHELAQRLGDENAAAAIPDS